MLKFHILVILTACYLSSLSQPNKDVSKFLNTKGFEAASIGICVKDMTGKDILLHNGKTALVPASTMKVVTTATAIEILGENYRFKTDIAINENNSQQIIIHGYGDPTLGSEHMNEHPDSFLYSWAEAITKSIDNNKPITIEIDDSYFGYNGISNKWLQEDMGNYYAAGSYGISIFDNTYRLYFNTVNTNAIPQILRTTPVMKNIIFDNQLSTNTSGKDNGYINGESFSNFRKIVGDIPANRKSFSIKGDIPDPGLYLGEILADALIDKQIRVNNITTYREKLTDTNDNTKTTDKTIYSQYSPYLKEIIKVVNVKSNNHYAEHLIRAVGMTKKDIPVHFNALHEGISITKNYWEQKGIDINSLFMYDGCGLSPSDKISPELLCDILIYMQTKSKYKDAFFASLPKAGKEGTVKSLLKGTRLEGKVFVKSGSIADVQCFAGYYIDGNKKYTFSIMVNNYNSLRRNTVKAIEELLLSIF